MTRLADSRLYFVSGDRPGNRSLGDVLRPAIAGGVDCFQLRMKNATDDEVLRAADDARKICSEGDIPFVLNDRPDLAARCGADGFHLGQEDMAITAGREQAPDLLAGRSTHSPDQIAAAIEERADYFAVGPVYLTPTKPGRPSVGLGLIQHAATVSTEIPWFAIGGIDLGPISAVADAGARRAVVVRAVAEAAEPECAARTLRAALD